MFIRSPIAVRFRSPGTKPFMRDAAAEHDVAAPDTCAHVVDPDAAGVEGERAVDRFEPVGQRQIPDAALLQPRAAAELRLVERAGHTGSERRGPGAANVPEEPLQDAEVGIPLGRYVDRLRREADVPVTSSAVPSPSSFNWSISRDVAIERQLDRTAVAQRIVEQFQVELLDAGIDEEVVMSASSPLTRTVPPATALVNGDSRGSKKRT